MDVKQRFAIETCGEGDQTLVLLHGYGCDKNMWQRLTPLLKEKYQIVLYDLMGSGNSIRTNYDRNKYSTLEGHASDLITILDDLEITNAVLVGHSVSAMTVALVANMRPDLADRVIMICPSPSFINQDDYVGGFERADIMGLLETLDANYLGWSSQMAPAIMGTPHMAEMGETLTNSFCQADPDIARHFAHVTFLSDHRQDIRNLNQKALALQCLNDVIVPPDVGIWMEKNMPNAEVVVLDAMGHCPHISYPQQTAAAMNSFLEAN